MSDDGFLINDMSDTEDQPDQLLPSQSISQLPTSEASSVTSKKRKAASITKSWIWQHALYPFEQKLNDSNGDAIWNCGTCKKHYKYSSGTGKGMKHLAKHGITEQSTRQKRIKTTQEHVNSLFSNVSTYPSTGRRTLEAANADLSLDILEQLIVRLVTVHSLPYSMLEWKEFRTLLLYINAEAEALLPASSNITKQWVYKNYEHEKEKIKASLATALSCIHFTADGWTSPNNIAILAVIAHYTDVDGNLTYSPLCMREIFGEHSGANMSIIVMETLQEYDVLPNKIGYFMMDNAGNNNLLMKHISEALKVKNNISYNPITHRLRCNGHILNLSVQAILNVKKKRKRGTGILKSRAKPKKKRRQSQQERDQDEDEREEVEPGEQEEQVEREEDEERRTGNSDAEDSSLSDMPSSATGLLSDKEVNEWRSTGPLAKIHALVIAIRLTPQRLAMFHKYSEGRNLVRDNDTRWNSWYYMLTRATEPDMVAAVNAVCANVKDLSALALNPDDWKCLTELQGFLHHFHIATLASEGRFHTVDVVIETFDYILESFETAVNSTYLSNPHLRTAINDGWNKLRKYYLASDRSPVYVTAMILRPDTKWSYIEENWQVNDWVKDAKKATKELWESTYKSKGENLVIPVLNPPKRSAFADWQARKKISVISSSMDEYERYLLLPILPEIQDARRWWMEKTQRMMFPNLSIMAIDILSIPAMSAEPERVFSGAKNTVTDHRNRLNEGSVNNLELLKHWYGQQAEFERRRNDSQTIEKQA